MRKNEEHAQRERLHELWGCVSEKQEVSDIVHAREKSEENEPIFHEY